MLNTINGKYFPSSNNKKFTDETVNEFLDVAKSEYPYSEINKTATTLDISLKKFSHKYDFKYENAIKKVLEFLKDIIFKFGLTEVNYINEDKEFFSPVFKIKVPSDIDSVHLNNLWDKIFEEVIEYMENEEIDFLLEDMFIVLHR